MTSTTSTFIPSEAVVAPSTDAPLGLLPVLVIDELVQHITPPTIDELFPDNLKPSTGVIAAGETLQTIGLPGPGAALQAAGQTMRAFGYDEAEEDSITGAGQTMDTDADDDLGAFFTIGSLVAAGIAFFKGTAVPAVVAGTKIAAAAAVAYGTEKAIEAATSDIDSDESLAQPWIPEVGVDALA